MMKFLRQQAHFKKRLKEVWRKPKGHHSKLREKRKGLHKMPNIGYKKPEKLRKKWPIIHNLKELKEHKKGEEIIIASAVGDKKRLELLKYCEKEGIIVKNIKNIKERIEKIEEKFKERIKKKKEKVKISMGIEKVEKPKKVKKVVVKKKEEKSLEEKLSEEK